MSVNNKTWIELDQFRSQPPHVFKYIICQLFQLNIDAIIVEEEIRFMSETAYK
jgi:hypothetical protein